MTKIMAVNEGDHGEIGVARLFMNMNNPKEDTMLKITTILFGILFGLFLWSDLAHADAAALYSKCQSCHGSGGQGNPTMASAFKADPSALSFQDGVADCVKTVAEGRNKMPAFGKKMSGEEIEEVCKHVEGLKK